MPLGKEWDNLVRDAVLGTDRRQGNGDVLLSAAMLAPMRRAALLPLPMTEPAPEPAAPELRPVAPEAAVLRLRHLLSSGSRQELLVWFVLANQRGLRIPAALVPRVLDEVGFSEALGEVGPWLMALNPAWHRRAEIPVPESLEASEEMLKEFA